MLSTSGREFYAYNVVPLIAEYFTQTPIWFPLTDYEPFFPLGKKKGAIVVLTQSTLTEATHLPSLPFFIL